MKIRVRETRVYDYTPDFEDTNDTFYNDHDVFNVEQAIEFDKKWIEQSKGVMEDLDKSPTITRVWELIGDDDQVVATF